jgi:hypothetical protein
MKASITRGHFLENVGEKGAGTCAKPSWLPWLMIGQDGNGGQVGCGSGETDNEVATKVATKDSFSRFLGRAYWPKE